MTPEQTAIQIVGATLGQPVQTIHRFETGLCHYTYDIVTGANRPLVARLAQPGNEAMLEGAVYWSERLRPQGVPLPELLGYDLTRRKFPYAYLLLERLPGQDLGQVYPGLTVPQKRRIAREVGRIQAIVNHLPPGSGYGFATGYQANLKASWTEVLQAELDRSRTGIEQAGVFKLQVVDRVQGWLAHFEGYFGQVAPTPFLDDTTTKNVIIYQGRLSGIVDVDMVCFGDPLFVVALTRMSLIARDYSLDYIEFWCEQLNLSERQRQILNFYTALFCVNFMSEIGHKHNREDPLAADKAQVARLYYLLDELLAGLD
jgi:aminoglycoside phosphotransferase (APT) family kinase protein